MCVLRGVQMDIVAGNLKKKGGKRIVQVTLRGEDFTAAREQANVLKSKV